MSDEQAGRGGRYQRSFGGLVGALVVLLLAIGAFVAFRALNRDDLEIRPESVDYLESVRELQEAGETVWYLAGLPDGWIATAVDRDPADAGFGVSMLSDQDRYAGVREEDAPAEELVERYLGEDAEEGGPVRLDSPVATEWRSFSDPGGDYGVAVEVGDETVLVFGTVGREAVHDLAADLTEAPLG